MAFVPLNPGTLLAPNPVVLVSAARAGERPNLITVAWAGIVCSKPPMVSISVKPERYSHELITQTGEFVINLVSEDMVRWADLCGVKSGRDIDKFAACGFDPEPAVGMKLAPAIRQAPAYLACKVDRTLPLGSHTMFVAHVISTGVAEHLMDQNGKIHLDQANLAAYCHGMYMTMHEPQGFFGFSVARPEVLARRRAELRPADDTQ